MQLQSLINYSDEYFYIDRFDDIVKIALSMKAQLFYVDSTRNKIFGFYEEGYSIIETTVPFIITNSFFFSSTNIKRDSIGKTYFYMKEYPYYLFPENKRADIMNHNIDLDIDEFKFIDRMTGKVLDDCIITINYEEWFKVDNYIRLLNSFYNRHRTLSYPIVFENMNENEIVQKVLSNKVSQGTELMVLKSDRESYVFYVFKSLLGPLTKADKLTISINRDIIEPNKFAITFTVHKKKSKLGISDVTQLDIQTHAFMINLV